MLLRFAVLACGIAAAAGANRTIFVIRHGEKTWGLGCLNAQGQARASALPSLFNGQPSPSHATFATPETLFANHYDDPIDCERCKQTLTPISQTLGLPLIFDYGCARALTRAAARAATQSRTHCGRYPFWLGGNSRAASAILQSNASTVLVAWEHVNIQYLV
jgi:hypothetical protein